MRIFGVPVLELVGLLEFLLELVFAGQVLFLLV